MWNAGTKPGADVGTCISRRTVLSAPLHFGVRLARLHKEPSEIKYHNIVPFPSSAVIDWWSSCMVERMVGMEKKNKNCS